MKKCIYYFGLLIASTVFLNGCLGVDRIVSGYFSPVGEQSLVGSNGVVIRYWYNERATLIQSSDEKVIWMSIPSGSRLEIKAPKADGLNPVSDYVYADSNSQNFDVNYRRQVYCDLEEKKFFQSYNIMFYKRGTHELVGIFMGDGPKHRIKNGVCPTLD